MVVDEDEAFLGWTRPVTPSSQRAGLKVQSSYEEIIQISGDISFFKGPSHHVWLLS